MFGGLVAIFTYKYYLYNYIKKNTLFRTTHSILVFFLQAVNPATLHKGKCMTFSQTKNIIYDPNFYITDITKKVIQTMLYSCT